MTDYKYVHFCNTCKAPLCIVDLMEDVTEVLDGEICGNCGENIKSTLAGVFNADDADKFEGCAI